MTTNHGADESRSKAAAKAREERRGRLGFSFVGEWVMISLLIAVLSIPLVTFPAVLAAGVAHMRRHVAGRDTNLGRLFREFAGAFRALWPAGLAVPAAVFFVDLNFRVAREGVIAGAGVALVATVLVAAVVFVVALRSASAWTDLDGIAWDPRPNVREMTRQALRNSSYDLLGSLIVVAAVAGCVGLVAAYWPLVSLFGGVVAVVLIGIESRRVRASSAA